MIQKTFAKALLMSLFGISMISAALHDLPRIEKLQELFTENTLQEAFNKLKGFSDRGSGKGDQLTEEADIAMLNNPTDPQAFIFCVKNGEWVVHPDREKWGKSAMTDTDANGELFIPKIIKSLQKVNEQSGINGKKVSDIAYTITTPAGKQRRLATVWDSKALLNRKNDTGQKFFCGTSVKAE